MKKLTQSLYGQVIMAVILGALLGYFKPGWGAAMKPLGDAFIRVVKMLIAPIIFTTVVTGIAKMGDLKKVGRVGAKGLLYFEILTTVALALGLIIANVAKPGAGMNVNVASLDIRSISAYTTAPHLKTIDFIMNIIPKDVADAFAKGDILQVLFFSILFGAAITFIKEDGEPVTRVLDSISKIFFRIMDVIMKVAPIGAFGAMAYTVGTFGIHTLLSLGKLMACFYVTSILFIIFILGGVLRWYGFSIFKFLRYIKEEVLIVLGTSSSESALPLMMEKMEKMGCSKSVVGLVIPMGYSFNLDGTSIYLTMAVLFIAQACNIHVSFTEQLEILGVLLLTSKGAAAVSGGGFITLAATLSVVGNLPVAGLALLLGIDRFMSQCRAIVNLIGNGVASVVISKAENELDMDMARRALDRTDDKNVTLSSNPGNAY